MTHEALIRLGCFLGVLAAVAFWEARAPRKRYGDEGNGRLGRWPANLGMVALSSVLLRLVFPLMPVGLAISLEASGSGLFPLLGLPYWAAFLLGVLVLDLAIYLQHRAFHAFTPLWLLHRMHHADRIIDASTGVRFHPLEYLFSMGLKLALVSVLGAPALAVLVFEVLLNCVSLFNHANGAMPPRLDAALRLLVVTPDMHRVHHSVLPRETNSNFGFNFPWWDRLLGTYRAQPQAGHQGMTIGLGIFREPRYRSFFRMLAIPFVRRPRS